MVLGIGSGGFLTGLVRRFEEFGNSISDLFGAVITDPLVLPNEQALSGREFIVINPEEQKLLISFVENLKSGLKEEEYHAQIDGLNNLSSSYRRNIANLKDSRKGLSDILSQIEEDDLEVVISNLRNADENFDDILNQLAIELLDVKEFNKSFLLFKGVSESSIKNRGIGLVCKKLTLFNYFDQAKEMLREIDDVESRNYVHMQVCFAMTAEIGIDKEYIERNFGGVFKGFALAVADIIVTNNPEYSQIPEEYCSEINTFDLNKIEIALIKVKYTNDELLINLVYMAACRAYIKLGRLEDAFNLAEVIRYYDETKANKVIQWISLDCAFQLKFEDAEKYANKIPDSDLKCKTLDFIKKLSGIHLVSRERDDEDYHLFE